MRKEPTPGRSPSGSRPSQEDPLIAARLETKPEAIWRIFEEAQAAFLTAEKKFRHLSEHPNVVTDPKINCRWWCALEELYQCDKKVWLLFVGQDRSVSSNMMYNDYRERLVKGRYTKANA